MRLSVGTFMLFVLVMMARDAEAVPSFTWTEPWNVTLLPNCGEPCNPLLTIGPRAFGASATQDGQIVDTTADIAVAKSDSILNIKGGAFGSTGVTFTRQFLLSDAPQGWAVSLGGILNGRFSGFALGISNNARVVAGVSIASSLGITFDARVALLEGTSPVNQSRLQTAELSDGLYTVAGSLVTDAHGFASSSFFFDSLSGFRVSVTATPIPEPSTLLLLATGLIAAAWGYRKRAA